MKRRTFIQSAAGLVAASAAWPSQAQTSWPTQPIKMIVPFPPGGQGDLAARPVAAAMQRILGTPVVVENLGGAGGAIGNARVARRSNDGHTLLMTLSSLAVLPEADRIMERPAMYEVAELVPIARVLADPTLLAVSKDTPWKSLAALIDDAKKRPGEITFGSSGPYGTLHVSMEMFTSNAGIKLNHVAYRGAGPALNDLVAGHIKALASAPGVLKQQVESGDIRVLANFGAKRVETFPDTPTFKELGFGDVEFYIWGGLFVPKATEPAVVGRLRDVMRQVMSEPETQKIFTAAASPPAYLDQPEFAAFIEADSKRLIQAVRKIGRIEGG